MTIQERRTLKEICLLVDRQAINVLWADEITKNGVVIHSTDHRGAYPVNENGEVDSTIAGILGGTLESIIGRVAGGLQQSVASLQIQLSEVQEIYADAVLHTEDLSAQLTQAHNTIAQLTAQLQSSHEASANELPAQEIIDEQAAPANE